jgi:hypothetical protein
MRHSPDTKRIERSPLVRNLRDDFDYTRAEGRSQVAGIMKVQPSINETVGITVRNVPRFRKKLASIHVDRRQAYVLKFFVFADSVQRESLSIGR